MTLKLEGRIVGEWAGLLEQECLHHLSRQRRIRLDLRAVSFITESSVEVLRGLIGRGVEISGASVLIDSLLNES